MKTLPKREDADKRHTWKLEDIFESDEQMQAEYDRLTQQIPELAKYKGRLTESAKTLLEAVRFFEDYDRKLNMAWLYSMLKESQDLTNSFYKGLSDKMSSLFTKVGEACAYFNPEVLKISEDTLAGFYAQEKELVHYRHYFEKLFREKPHTLSLSEETILAAASKICEAPSEIFSMLENADMKFGNVEDKDKNELELTLGRYIAYMESPDRTLRENAFNALYDEFIAHKHAIAAAYSASVDKDIFISKTRKYSSCIERSLFYDNMPLDVYKNLISAVHEYLPHMYKYVNLRKKRLGVEELHMYDIYTPIVADIETDISYEEACDTVIKALSILGEDYVAVVKEGFEKGWIDVFENVGKRSGAFAASAYDSHPYVLLNYSGKISDMFTIAHEIGHAAHSYFSAKHQSCTYADYPIFLAEVASTVNEALLMDYLLKNTDDAKMKEYLLNYYLENFRGTLFRQTMFAEFEMMTHEAAEQGQPLTVDFLQEMYYGLVKKYFGNGICADEKIAYEWSRIPHFYSAFYVYKYATGYSAAIAFCARMLEGGQGAINAYKAFLMSGGSDYPLEILKKAGVDMSSPGPVRDALDVFASIVAQFEGSADEFDKHG
ncbi:MAG: oligoendopeptidase F [Oscillospiraceae bacterium]|nr:oligoendopeptidase F [Oscillospiraceae bacterium]